MMIWLKVIPAALGLVPRWVWYVLLAALAWHFALSWHAGKVKTHDAAVIAARDAQWQQRLAEERRAALAWKGKAEAAARTISDLQRKLNDETNVRIGATAADLQLHGPGKAAAPTDCRPGAGAGVPAGPGQSQPGSRQPVDAGSAALPANDGTADRAVVPWGWLVGRGKQCDLDRAETLTWRSWYAQQASAWEKMRASAADSPSRTKGTPDAR